MARKPKVWPQTQWRMFECDHGARWTTVQDHDVDGALCYFSGCSQDHHIPVSYTHLTLPTNREV